MSAALPFPRKFSRRANFIWLGEADPDGRPLDPRIKEVAYQKQADLARYRADEMTDEAEVASLIEQAVYATSKIASERDLNNPAGYLFRTYTNLVDTTLRRTVEAFGLESHVLAHIAKSESPEQVIVKSLTRQKLVDCMDEKGRALWERHLLGYGIDELAAEEGQTADYVGKRLRRAAKRALHRLFDRTSSDS